MNGPANLPDLSPFTPQELAAAAELLRRRQSAGWSREAGTWDAAGRWYPSPEEQRPCCTCVRAPSRRWPYSLLNHCRTVRHLALRFEVDPRRMRMAAKAVQPWLEVFR